MFLVFVKKIKFSKENQFASFNAQIETIVLELDPDPVGPYLIASWIQTFIS
jgi:hypothetical protein